ncbi:MAG: carbohydrate ABC transporter permease [Halobacteriales archaeon]
MASEETADDNAVEGIVRTMMTNPEDVYDWLGYIGLGFFTLYSLFPFYWLMVLALTPNKLIADMGLLPKGFHPESFVTVFQRVPLHHFLFNSFVMGVLTTIIVIFFGSIAGYVFGRLEFRGRVPLMLGILIIAYFPPAAFLIPLFRLFTGNVEFLGISFPVLFNTPGAIVFPLSALIMPLAIYILATFYNQIPDGLEDAARVEGSTRLGALFKVIVPLSAPAVASIGVLTFIIVYNEFFFSYLMTNGQASSWAPIVWGILKYQGTRQVFYNLMAAASLIGIVPMAIAILLAQEKIVSGLTAGALKE